MKRKTALLLILAAAVLLFVFSKQQEPEHFRATADMESFEIFNGAPPLLNIVFEYPKSWKISVSRSRGAEEATVQAIGPRDLIHQFSTSFAVIGKKITGSVLPEEEAKKLIERNKALNQFKIISKKKVRVAGQEAQQVAFDFVLNLPMDVQNAPSVTMREEVMLVARNDMLYQVHFIGTLAQHLRNKALFENLLKSLQLTS